MRFRFALIVLLSLTFSLACGGSGGGSNHPAASAPTPSSDASPGAAGELLFAALEPGGDLTALRDNSVAIVRLNGTATAKAKLTPRQLPRIGNAAPLPQPEARVGGGKVFFVDSAGVVRALAPDGTTTNVTTLPFANSQDLLSFAVSPDGTQVLGADFSFPPVHNPPPQAPIDPPFAPGDFTMQLVAANVGQKATTLLKRNWPQSGGAPRDVLSLVGWSPEAPLATIDTQLGSQQGSLGRRMFGHVAELDTAGRPGPPIGGYTCDAWSVLSDETVLCDDDGQLRNFSVRGKSGDVRYHLHASGDSQFLSLSLAPDAAHVVFFVNGGRTMVADANGKIQALPAGFRPQGWLGSTIVIGAVQNAQGDGDLAVVHLDRPTRLDDLGFKGFFVGVVQGG